MGPPNPRGAPPLWSVHGLQGLHPFALEDGDLDLFGKERPDGELDCEDWNFGWDFEYELAYETAVVKLQAAVRGKQGRTEVAQKKKASKRVSFSSMLCVNSRAANYGGSDPWLCGCGGRAKKAPKIPAKGLPGLARPPSFSRQEMADKEMADKAKENDKIWL